MTGIPDDHATTNKAFPFTDKASGGFGDWKDELNRQDLCNQVGSLLLEHRSPEGIAISIEGEWGSGKSSVLAMIKAFLTIHKQDLSSKSSGSLTRIAKFKRWLRRHRRKSPLAHENCTPILAEFNPWLVGAADHMIQAFMAQIASELGQVNQNAKATEAAQRLIAYAQLLEPLKWIPGAEPWTSIVRGVVDKTGQGVKKVSELHKLNISKQRDALKKTLLELNRNIIIFIDDIDRLPPPEVFQIVRAIQAVSDLPRCSFVIALDPFYTEKALQTAASFESPGQYLDKIIQLRLFLPQVNKADLELYFEKRLWQAITPLQQDRFRDEQKRLSQIWQLGVKPLIQTPRDVIRIINRFLYIEPRCGMEVCWGDLLGLQTIAIVLPNVFRHIIQNPGAYTGIDMVVSIQLDSPQQHVEQFADERENVLKFLPGKTRIQAQRLLEELFPLLRELSVDKLSQQEFSKARRIAANDRLRIALTYDLPSDEVSQADVQSFCCDPESRQTVIRRAIDKGLLDRILELTLQDIDLSKVADKKEFVVFLGTIVEDQQINGFFQGSRPLFAMSTIDKIIRLSEVVLASLGDEGDELCVLTDFVSNPSILSLTTHLLASRLAKRKDRLQPSEITSTKTFIPASENPVLREWFDTAVNAFRSEAFTEIADKWIIVRILLSLQEGRAQIPDLLQPYINSDHSIDAIADIFISNKTDSTEGTTVACKNEYLSVLGDPDIIRARAESRLSDPSVQANKRLFAIYKSIAQQQKIYVENAEPEQEWSDFPD
jgi:hypothetical protein